MDKHSVDGVRNKMYLEAVTQRTAVRTAELLLSPAVENLRATRCFKKFLKETSSLGPISYFVLLCVSPL